MDKNLNWQEGRLMSGQVPERGVDPRSWHLRTFQSPLRHQRPDKAQALKGQGFSKETLTTSTG